MSFPHRRNAAAALLRCVSALTQDVMTLRRGCLDRRAKSKVERRAGRRFAPPSSVKQPVYYLAETRFNVADGHELGMASQFLATHKA